MGFFDSGTPEQRSEDALSKICDKLSQTNELLEKILEKLNASNPGESPDIPDTNPTEPIQ